MAAAFTVVDLFAGESRVLRRGVGDFDFWVSGDDVSESVENDFDVVWGFV